MSSEEAIPLQQCSHRKLISIPRGFIHRLLSLNVGCQAYVHGERESSESSELTGISMIPQQADGCQLPREVKNHTNFLQLTCCCVGS